MYKIFNVSPPVPNGTFGRERSGYTRSQPARLVIQADFIIILLLMNY